MEQNRRRPAPAHPGRRPADDGLRLHRRHRARQRAGGRLRRHRRGLQHRVRDRDEPRRAGDDAAEGHGLRSRRRVRPAARGQRRDAAPGRHRQGARPARLGAGDRPGGRPDPPRGLVARRAPAREPAGGGLLMDVPFAKPTFNGDEGAAVAAVIASGWVSPGPKVAEFEARFADRVGAAAAVAVSNCTTALSLALFAEGVGPGDEVIVPSLSFIATANAVWAIGATPVFADIDPMTYNLDVGATRRAITPQTKAIMPVHQVGLPADMDAFFALADEHGLALVEDAACPIGASYNGQAIGSLGPSA